MKTFTSMYQKEKSCLRVPYVFPSPLPLVFFLQFIHLSIVSFEDNLMIQSDCDKTNLKINSY